MSKANDAAIRQELLSLFDNQGSDEQLRSSTALRALTTVTLDPEVADDLDSSLLLNLILKNVLTTTTNPYTRAASDYLGWGWTQKSYSEVLKAAVKVPIRDTKERRDAHQRDVHMQKLLERVTVRHELVGQNFGAGGRTASDKYRPLIADTLRKDLIEFCNSSVNVLSIVEAFAPPGNHAFTAQQISVSEDDNIKAQPPVSKTAIDKQGLEDSATLKPKNRLHPIVVVVILILAICGGIGGYLTLKENSANIEIHFEVEIGPEAPPNAAALAEVSSTYGLGVLTFEEPSTDSPKGEAIPEGESVDIVCQIRDGEILSASTYADGSDSPRYDGDWGVWNKLDNGYWIPDLFVNTPKVPGDDPPEGIALCED
ncbi:hypothetical protein [Glycomyces harbinensis]|uniref:Uncharacterized protein n=1 Tax=Glycomyces harbinensis TaxID=58114 RepID=A0A1G7BK10_9ACTN|nr:hypothetical protein [Glycomyces harbinensis]SDE27418.1 hypothetical protein SAMN05216270_1178 [Glycomyces harbinensis]